MSEKINGTLALLGNSVGNHAGSVYSLIEIGDRILKKIACPASLDNYLHRALDQGEPVTLYIAGKSIYAITLSNNKTYYFFDPISIFSGLVLIAVGIPFSFILIGIPMVIFGAQVLSRTFAAMSLGIPGAIRV